MDQLLKFVEGSEDQETTTRSLQAKTQTWIHPDRVHNLSFELWGFLNSNFTGKAKVKFDNVGRFEGFEAWRQTLKLVRDRAVVRKIHLNEKVHRPHEAKKLSDVPVVLEEWDMHLREYEQACGQPLTFEDKRMALINIIPANMKTDMMLRLHAHPQPPPGSSGQVQDAFYNAMRNSFQQQLELMIQLQRSSPSLNRVDVPEDDASGDHQAGYADWDDVPDESDPSFPLYQVAQQAYAVYQNSRQRQG